MSTTMVIWPIIAALCQAGSFIGVDPGAWQPVNQQQTYFMNNYFKQRSELKLFNEQEMRSWASWSHIELNQILRNNGFSIQLQPFGLEGFGIVSIQDILVTWLNEGQRTQITTKDGKVYPAVKLEKGYYPHESFSQEWGSYFWESKDGVIVLSTKSGDKVYLAKADKPLEGFALLQRIQEIRDQLRHEVIPIIGDENCYDSIIFPMVDLDQEVNIAWLKGMKLNEYYIAQALQQTKLKMNEKGARVKSAIAIGMEKCMRRENTLVLDEPFYMWIERFGVSMPIFAGYITQNDWKDPQNLDM